MAVTAALSHRGATFRVRAPRTTESTTMRVLPPSPKTRVPPVGTCVRLPGVPETGVLETGVVDLSISFRAAYSRHLHRT